LGLAQRTGIDVVETLTRFQRQAPPWLGAENPTSKQAVAAMLNHLRGTLAVIELARQMGVSRFALSRWLKGTAEPKAPEFLNLIQCCTHRIGDFIAAFVEPDKVPAIHHEWQRQQRARRAAYEMPWSHAVLRALELADYAGLKQHRPGWLARRVGITRPEEERCLRVLSQTGQIEFDGKRWRLRGGGAVDLRHEPEAARAQRGFWARVAADRVADDAGMFAYNICGVSRKDLARLQSLQRDYLKQARAIIAESQPVEQVVLMQVQIFALEGRRGRPRPSRPS
jgi:AraC-like DNA-binding protein